MLLALALAACGSPDTDDTAATDPGDDSAAETGVDSGVDSGGDSGDSAGETGDDQDGDGVPDDADCAPTNPARAAGLPEACDYVDNDCDGATTDLAQTLATQTYLADGSASTRYEYEYDDNFDNVAYRSESPGGFHYDQRTTFSRHLPVEITVDNTGDDAIDIRTLNTYDAEDRQLSSVSDQGDDGTFDSGLDATYDDDGVGTVRYWSGTPDHVYYRLVTDPWGHHLLEETDAEGDGTFTATSYAYTYDADGHPLTQEVDTGDDGTVDLYIEIDWQGDRQLAVRYDSNLDGTWDVVGAYTYDAAGRPLTSAWDYLDGPDYAETYTYDGQGRSLSRLVDYGADGAIDERSDWVYTGDDRYDLTQTVSGATYTVVGTVSCP